VVITTISAFSKELLVNISSLKFPWCLWLVMAIIPLLFFLCWKF